jgi:hypothetical protein
MDPNIPVGIFIGFAIWFLVRYLAGGIYTVDQNQRAVQTTFGRAERIPGAATLNDAILAGLDADEKQRYRYPQVRVIMPGGPYYKWPWQRIYKVSIATQTVNMAFDPDSPGANQSGTIVDAVTKDQLNTGLTGQIRYRISERNLYANIFGVKKPIAHVMGYFVSVLRERIATFEAPAAAGAPEAASGGISINDLRKNLRDLNEHMDRECGSSEARYGIVLDASQKFDNLSDTYVAATVPPGAKTGMVTVTTFTGSMSGDRTFLVAPQVKSFTPTSGTVGTLVTITGVSLTQTTAVAIGGKAATFTVQSDAEVTATVPAGAKNGAEISVTTAGGNAPFGRFDVVPKVASFSPVSGPVGTSVEITGNSFTGATKVTFGAVSSTSLEVISDTQVDAVVPSGAVTGPIAVTTPGGTGTGNTNFTVVQ